jgi:hypothetical protein
MLLSTTNRQMTMLAATASIARRRRLDVFT